MLSRVSVRHNLASVDLEVVGVRRGNGLRKLSRLSFWTLCPLGEAYMLQVV
jgi:hypothetical protein